jgi:tetratricopeptide (TPR) repeat protein/transposase
MKRDKTTNDLQFRMDVIHSANEVGISTTARAFGINRKTVYRWLKRFELKGVAGLQNELRPKFNHPNKMLNDIEAKIIAYKKAYPQDSALKIIRELQLDYSLPTVLKKLRNAGLQDSPQSLKIDHYKQHKYKPFQILFFSVNKLDIVDFSNRSVYCFTAHDFKSGFLFHSFAAEINQLVFENFTTYVYEKLSSLGITVKSYTAIPVRRKLLSYWLSKRQKVPNIVRNFEVKINHLETSQMTLENNLILKKIKSLFLNIKAKNMSQILLKSTVAFALHNTNCFRNNPQIPKHLLKIYPVNLDQSLSQESLKTNQISNSEDKEFSDKLIKHLINITSQLLEGNAFQKASNYADLMLDYLVLYPEEKKLISKALIMKAKISQNLSTVVEAEVYYKQSLQKAQQSSTPAVILKSELALADFYLTLNNYILAGDHLLAAYNLAKEHQFQKEETVTARLLAMNYLEMGQKEKGFRILKSNWLKVQYSDNSRIIIEYMISLAIFHQRSGNLQISENYLKKAETQMVSILDPHFHSMVYSNLISHYSAANDISLTRYYIAKMLELIPKLNRISKLEKAYNIIGSALTNLHEYDEALKYFLKELQIAKKHDLKVPIMASHINIAGFYYYQKKYSNALIHTKQSLKIAKKLNHKKGILLIVINMIELLFIHKKFNEAFQLLNEYMPLAKGYNSASELYNFNVSYLKLYVHWHKLLPALQYSRKALEAAKLLKNAHYISTTLFNIGYLNLDLKNFRAAIINLNKAERLALENDFSDLLAEIKLSKAEYFFAMKNNSQADQFLEEAAIHSEKLNNQELNTKIKNLNLNFRKMKLFHIKSATMLNRKIDQFSNKLR